MKRNQVMQPPNIMSMFVETPLRIIATMCGMAFIITVMFIPIYNYGIYRLLPLIYTMFICVCVVLFICAAVKLKEMIKNNLEQVLWLTFMLVFVMIGPLLFLYLNWNKKPNL